MMKLIDGTVTFSFCNKKTLLNIQKSDYNIHYDNPTTCGYLVAHNPSLWIDIQYQNISFYHGRKRISMLRHLMLRAFFGVLSAGRFWAFFMLRAFLGVFSAGRFWALLVQGVFGRFNAQGAFGRFLVQGVSGRFMLRAFLGVLMLWAFLGVFIQKRRRKRRFQAFPHCL